MGSVLITGAGLIGSHAARALKEGGHQVFLYDSAPSPAYLETVLPLQPPEVISGEITDLEALSDVMGRNDVRAVVHTAGLIGASVTNEPLRGIDVNLKGTAAVAEAARLTGVSTLVFCSTMAVYDFDSPSTGPAIDENWPLGPKNLYAATKLAAEILLDQYAALSGTDLVVLRLAGVFGRGQYNGGSWMGRIVNRVIEASLAGETVRVRPEWIGMNEFIYVKDVAQAIVNACSGEPGTPGTYNIGTGQLHSVHDLIGELRSLLTDARIDISDGGETVSYLKRSRAFDISRARARLRFEPRFSLREGLQDYIEEVRKFSGRYNRLR